MNKIKKQKQELNCIHLKRKISKLWTLVMKEKRVVLRTEDGKPIKLFVSLSDCTHPEVMLPIPSCPAVILGLETDSG